MTSTTITTKTTMTTTTVIKMLLFLAVIFAISNAYSYRECNKRCGEPPWHIAGMCDRNTGRCLCYYGWTGPNSRYRPNTRNKIEADYCSEACHYTHDIRNDTCTYQGENYRIGKENECEPLCGNLIFEHIGTCLKDHQNKDIGGCLCLWGWTGPGALYRYDGRVVANYCVLPCHYSFSFRNPVCAGEPADRSLRFRK